MRTATEKSTAKNKMIQPFKVKEAVAGLALDRADEAVLKYLNFFSGPIPIEGLSFLHVIPNTRARLPLTIAPGVEISKEDEEKASRELSEKVAEAMPARAASDIQYLFLSLEVLMIFVVGIFISYKAKVILDRRIEKKENEEMIELASHQQP